MTNKRNKPSARFGASFWIKLVIIVAVLATMPFIAPAAIELIVLADLIGLEALLLYLLYQARSSCTAFLAMFAQWRFHFVCTLLLLAGLYFLEPEVFLSHLGASFLILTIASSVTLATLLWLPPPAAQQSAIGIYRSPLYPVILNRKA